MAQESLIPFGCLTQSRQPLLLLGDHKEVYRTLRAEVMESNALIVLVDEVGGDLLLCDLVKDGGLCMGGWGGTKEDQGTASAVFAP